MFRAYIFMWRCGNAMEDKELKKEIGAVLSMLQKRIDRMTDKLRDCEILKLKQKAALCRSWIKFFYRTQNVLIEARNRCKGRKANGSDTEESI